MATGKRSGAGRKKQGRAVASDDSSATRKKPNPRSSSGAANTEHAKPATATARGEGGLPVVGIGASAGGLEAFEAFFRATREDCGLAFVLVAHLDPSRVSMLPELIQKATRMPVRQAEAGAVVEGNTVYVIPPNKVLTISDGVLQLAELGKLHGHRLPIDTFLRSLAHDKRADAACVILSGTGADGTLGLKEIKDQGGVVLVQTEGSAKYDGMPRSAINTGLADWVLPPEEMPNTLIAYFKHTSQPRARITATDAPGSDVLDEILTVLRCRTGQDFSHYKRNTICRRIERRMNMHQIDDLEEYLRRLQDSTREAESLFKELLIGVTSFFRDPPAFAALKKTVLDLISSRPPNSGFRVWVPGCATGEEAYSIAMLLHECMHELNRYISVQVFATDIDEQAISAARSGRFLETAAGDLGPQRLARYFEKEEDGRLRARSTIREMLVFAVQNLIKDPPFTKLDLISCRNLLIYLDQELQRKLLPMFHYSLKDGGVLFLGSSETVGRATDLFASADAKGKVFTKKPSARETYQVGDFPAEQQGHGGPQERRPAGAGQTDRIGALELVETILKHSGTPPCVIVDDSYNVVYIHGRTGMFLEPAEGNLNYNLLEMARPGLRTELTAALGKVARDGQPVVRRGLGVEQDGRTVSTDLSVERIFDQLSTRTLFMVTMERVAKPKTSGVRRESEGKAGTKAGGKTVEELELELQESRESLQTSIEELETSNEELKSTNEELQSTNEELQSTNEELETSKEELQSLNEESATVNAELQARVEELFRTNDDLKNLLDSTEIAIVFLDTDLCVRRFTPPATRIIPLVATDIGRLVTQLSTELVDTDLKEHADLVLDDLQPREVKVVDTSGRRLRMRVRPYRTTQNVIDGVVITFEDITEIEAARAADRRVREHLEAIVDTVREPLLVLDSELRVLWASRAFYRVFGVAAASTEGRLLYELGSSQWDIPALRELLEQLIAGSDPFEDFRVEHDFPGIGHQVMFLNARRLSTGCDPEELILLAIEANRGP